MAEAAKWYVVHTYSGYENTVKATIEKTIETRQLQDLIHVVSIPMETVTEITDNGPKTYDRKVFPGYVLVKMIMSDEAWYIIKNVRGVTGFVGSGTKPTPLTDEEVQQLGFEQVVLTNVQFPKLSKKQDYGTTNGVSRADQLKADIAALQDRLSGKVTLWFSYTLDQCKNSSVALDVPALTLGVQNLLVTSDAAMDADALQALETAATDAGVENLTVHAADRFETDRVSG